MNDPWEDVSSYVDVEVAKAMSHPMRAHILSELNKTVMSPRRYSERFDVRLSTASYHFRALEEADCLEVVREVPRGPAVEHFYRATKKALFDGEAWERLPETIRNKLSGRTTTDLLEAVSEAMLEETFDSRVDRLLAWQHAHLDEQGWNEGSEICQRAARELLQVEKGARSRLIRSGDLGMMATWGLLFFESPFPKPDPL
jgi:DNA-binding transcriptional ArsR family regulator